MIRKSDYTPLDALDNRIIELLRQDGRRRNVDIASILSVSERTVRNRIERLVADHGLRFGAHLPERPATRVIYLLHAAPGTRFELARVIARLEPVTAVHLTNGVADLVVSARFDDASEALDFAVSQLESDARITRIGSCTVIRDVSEVGSTLEHANVPRVDKEHLVKSLIQIPEFGTIEQALWWFARILKRAFAADHLMLTTTVFEGLADHNLLFEPHVITLDLPQEYVNALSERVSADDGKTFTLVRRAMTTRQHAFVEDARSSALLHLGIDLIPLAGYVSVAAFPMLYGDIILGAAVLYYDTRITTSDEFIANVQRALDFFVVANRPLASSRSSSPEWTGKVGDSVTGGEH